jgi:peptidoglycan/LPS O-acetylase OafA/YrhL
VALALVIAASVLLAEIPQRLAYEAQLFPTAFALIAGVFVVCAVAGETVVARGLSLRPMVFLGRISYSLYLWHLPLLVAFAGVDRELGLPTIAAVAVAVALASCSRKFIELPFLLRRTGAETGRLDGKPAPAPA